MTRYVRFGYAESGIVHFFHQKRSNEDGTICGQKIRGSGWRGTTTKRESIKGDHICGNCLKKIDVPWEDE